MLDADAFITRFAGQAVYLDTNIFIYLLGNHPHYAPVCVDLLQACADRKLLGITGDGTLAELLVKPLQLNDAAAVAAVRELLMENGTITLINHSRRAFERAADLRARHRLKMMDALQLATALEAGAKCLISNDRQFPVVLGIDCISLDG